MSEALREGAGVNIVDVVRVQIWPANPAPEPELPRDVKDALGASGSEYGLG